MTSFAQQTQEGRPPARTLMLEPWIWADEWDAKPRETVCVGLRRMSETDKSKARSEAEKLADDLHPSGGPNWTDAFNDCLMRQVAALAICSPNDVRKPSEIMPYAEETVRFALNSQGTRWIFDQFTRFELETSQLDPEATDEEIDELCDLLGSTETKVSPGARKLLRYVLEELRGAD